MFRVLVLLNPRQNTVLLESKYRLIRIAYLKPRSDQIRLILTAANFASAANWVAPKCCQFNVSEENGPS
jgi:hypothetical protein